METTSIQQRLALCFLKRDLRRIPFSSPFAPIYAGLIYDASGSYSTPFTLFTALILASVLIVCLAKEVE
ncbi:MAG: hypothetical protein ACUVV4_07910 [Candidatus Bathyarchaeia archaeon]